MKIATGTAPHQSSHSGTESRELGIKSGSKMFSMLIDGIYTNKIRAVVREICTNAADSHVEAGCESMPFDVHLPTHTDPRFIVRDYGVGMDDEMVMGLFSTLGDSSKDLTDDLVGGFGLGSKTPFAYTDSFEVICRDGVTRRVYQIFYNENKIPTIERIGEVPDTLARGVEVAVPVREEDFSRFEEEMTYNMLGFSPVPNVDAHLSLATPKFFYEAANDDELSYMILDGYALPGQDTLWIRQGCVIYPVGTAVGQNIREIMQHRAKLVVDVPIGTAQVATNREALSFDEGTLANLTAIFDGLDVQVKREIFEKCDAECKTMLQAQEWWFDGEASKSEMTSLFTFNPAWNGKPVSRNIYLNTLLPKDSDGNTVYLTVKVNKNRKPDELKMINFGERHNVKYVYHPVGVKVLRATKRYATLVDAEGRWGPRVYNLGEVDPKVLTKLRLLTGAKAEQFISLADLPDPGAPTKEQRESGTFAGAYVILGHRQYSPLVKKDKPAKGECYWVTTDRTTNNTSYSVKNKVNDAVASGLLDKDRMIISLTIAAQERLKLDPADQLDTAITTAVAAKHSYYVECYFKYLYNEKITRATMYSRNGIGLAELSEAGVVALYTDVPEPHTFVRYLNDGDKQTAEQKCATLVRELKEKYPLLFGEVDKATIQWYISSRDKELQTNQKGTDLP